MQYPLDNLLKRLDDPALRETNVISWGSPVPSFGDLSRSTVATLGLNPSNREFVDPAGNELDGAFRRFHTLKSLGLKKWSAASTKHLDLISISCRDYFSRNPYDQWFRGLDQIISGTKASYYGGSVNACHLDLIPYATSCKWTELTNQQQLSLLNSAGDTLGLLLKAAPVRLLVLNGASVINNLERLSGIKLDKKPIRDWTLPRNSGKGIEGFAYQGTIRDVAGIRLNRDIHILGFNHNIQSSFGVTNEVKSSIRRWISSAAEGVLS